MDVKYDFDDSVWDDISDSAKDLIRNLLVKAPSKRFTASHCLEHAWVRGTPPPSHPLPPPHPLLRCARDLIGWLVGWCRPGSAANERQILKMNRDNTKS